MKTYALMLAALILPLPALAQDGAGDTAITIYSKAQPGSVDPAMYRPVNGQPVYSGLSVPGYGIVRQTRVINLPQKESVVNFSDVAALIDPTTVQFKSVTDPKGTKVAEQNYQFDLVSQQKLIEKYIDKNIVVEKQAGDNVKQIEGTLLSSQGGLTLKTSDGVQAINGYSTIKFPELPGGLITKPTLVWNIITGKPGEQRAEVSYETRGITWWADYNLVFHEGKDANSGMVDFSSWVSIINQTGAGYKNAKLKLIAGDVERAPQAAGMMMKTNIRAEAMDMAAPAAPRFAEKAFFEYHMYTLDRPVTLPDNSTKQMELIPAVSDVPVVKELVYNGQETPYYPGAVFTDRNYGIDAGEKKVAVLLKLHNKKESGLGVPLPAGRIRVSQRDDDGSLEFIGENVLDHTPSDEDLTVKLGNAFDVVGERRQVDFRLDTGRHVAEEEIEIVVRNHKKQPVKVTVLENMYRTAQWEIMDAQPLYKKDDAHRISFHLNIEPDKEEKIRYKVRYTW